MDGVVDERGRLLMADLIIQMIQLLAVFFCGIFIGEKLGADNDRP
jgi:hypothetical protein